MQLGKLAICLCIVPYRVSHHSLFQEVREERPRARRLHRASLRPGRRVQSSQGGNSREDGSGSVRTNGQVHPALRSSITWRSAFSLARRPAETRRHRSALRRAHYRYTAAARFNSAARKCGRVRCGYPGYLAVSGRFVDITRHRSFSPNALFQTRTGARPLQPSAGEDCPRA